MPGRLIPLVTNQFYHIFNRGINKQPIFVKKSDYQRLKDLLKFYSFKNPPLRFSKFLKLSIADRSIFLEKLFIKNEKLIDIIAFCFMPNHFHFLLQQKQENGISIFMSKLQNSYTRYFNTKHLKIGPILQGQFKSVFIEDEKQLLHLSRYIHLNPYTSSIVKNFKELTTYPWSSFYEYINPNEKALCNKEIVLSYFRKTNYKQFVFDQADYQRQLNKIKHLVLEEDLLL